MRFGRGKRPKVSGVQGFLVDVGGDPLVDVGGDLLVDVGGDLGRQCRRGHLPGTVADQSPRERPHRAASEITVPCRNHRQQRAAVPTGVVASVFCEELCHREAAPAGSLNLTIR